MVDDKLHGRARGGTNMLTRQPPDGRVRDGGLRYGEMERDAIMGHGAAMFMKERTVDVSDIYSCNVCDFCGLIAHKVPKKRYFTCRTCKNTTNISKIVIPYAFKLFMQELRSMNILGRIKTSKNVSIPKTYKFE
jgi:DNA-directed RNA polymerase II subunit RPB2